MFFFVKFIIIYLYIVFIKWPWFSGDPIGSVSQNIEFGFTIVRSIAF